MHLAFSPFPNPRCKLSNLLIRQPGVTSNGWKRQPALQQQAGCNLLPSVSVAVVVTIKKRIIAGFIPRISLGLGRVQDRRSIRFWRGGGDVRRIKVIIISPQVVVICTHKKCIYIIQEHSAVNQYLVVIAACIKFIKIERQVVVCKVSYPVSYICNLAAPRFSPMQALIQDTNRVKQ